MEILTDQDFLIKAKEIIAEAKTTIEISTFKAEYNEKPIGKKLKELVDLISRKAKEGVTTLLLLNWNQEHKSVARTNIQAMQILRSNGVQARHLKSNRCNHAKLIIVDSKKAIIGSHNLSVRSCGFNFEMSPLINNDIIVPKIRQIFLQSFNDGETFH